MRALEFIIEHSNWPEDDRISERDMLRLRDVTHAAAGFATTKGIEITFTKHFFDQLKLKRGAIFVTPDSMMSILGKIINRGVKFFNGKETRTSYVFEDPATLMFMLVTKLDDNRFQVTTVVRDTKWKAPGQVIKL